MTRDFGVAGGGGEAAVVAGEDVLGADGLGPAQDAVGDDLGVLDRHVGVGDHAWDEDLAFGQLAAIGKDAPLVFVARIGGLEGVGTGADA